MKYPLTLMVVCALLFSCSNKNQQTTELLNSKKAIEDSIQEAKQLETFYTSRSKTEINEGADSVKWSVSADSAGYYFRKGMELKQRLKAIDFSIDSISRMK